MFRTIVSNPCKKIQETGSQLLKNESVLKVVKVTSLLAISTFSFTLACTSLVLYYSYKAHSYASPIYSEEQRVKAEAALEKDRCIRHVEEVYQKYNEKVDENKEFTPEIKAESKAIIQAVFDRIKKHPEYLSQGAAFTWIKDRIKEYEPECKKEYLDKLGYFKRLGHWLNEPVPREK